MDNEKNIKTFGNLNRSAIIAILIATLAIGGIGYYTMFYNPAPSGPPTRPATSSANIGKQTNPATENAETNETTSELINTTTSTETEQTVNATDTSPETPQFNETEVIVIDNLRLFSSKAYQLSQYGFGSPAGGINDKEIKAEMDAYIGKTLEITTNATREIYSRNLGYSVNGVLVKQHVIFLHSDYKDYRLECIIADDAIQDFQNIKIGDIVTFQGKLFSYSKVSDYQQTLPGSLPRNTILCDLKDCRIVKTQ